jgi:hypothetical protein
MASFLQRVYGSLNFPTEFIGSYFDEGDDDNDTPACMD